MKAFLKKATRPAIFTLVGAAAGYAYYHFVGCTYGACAIAAYPLRSTLYVAVIGYLLSIVFAKKEEK